MNEIKLTVKKDDVWNEVAKTTSYTGDKMTGDEDAYERILITDEDVKVFQRFWEEACAAANEQLKEMLASVSGIGEDYIVTLNVSRAYDTTLNESVQAALRGYFIQIIVGRWYKFANKGEVESYFAAAAALIDDVLRKLYSRKRPQRPNRN